MVGAAEAVRLDNQVYVYNSIWNLKIFGVFL